MSEPLLAVRDLHAWYGEGHALHGVNLDVFRGETVTLLGGEGFPIRYGWLNERDYTSKRRLLEDIQIIIEEGLKNELGLDKKDLVNYRAVLVVPDLYERNYVTDMVELLMREIRFSEICIIHVSPPPPAPAIAIYDRYSKSCYV